MGPRQTPSEIIGYLDIIFLFNAALGEDDNRHTSCIRLADCTGHAGLLDVGYNGAVSVMGAPGSRKDFIVANAEGFNSKHFCDLFVSSLHGCVDEG